jgi:hypothetical protein
MNLNNLNLVELNAQEMEEVEGGIIWWVLGIVVAGVVADWDDFKKGISGN